MSKQTATQEASNTTVKAPAKPKVPLSTANEAQLTQLKETVNVPGTRIGYLARGMETVLRDVQERLNKDGDAVEVKTALGHTVKVPITANVAIMFRVEAGEGDETKLLEYSFILKPNPKIG